MKENIDLWTGWPKDLRCDTDRNARLLNIVFHGGTFGNFLKFIIDKFSKLSPDLLADPFTKIGTSHEVQNIKFSGLVQRYHPMFINDNKGLTGLPVCIILPSSRKHFLFLKKSQWFRSSDQQVKPDDLWSVPIGEINQLQKESIRSILEVYDLKHKSHFDKIPKFIVRDWYKLNFLQKVESTFDYKWFDTLRTHEFFKDQKIYHLDLETFFNWPSFIKNLTELDRFFGLEVDFGRSEEMKKLFEKGLFLDNIRQECNMASDVCDNDADAELTGLDVSTEAFIYAEYERKNPNIQMPLTNRFFRDTEEIRQFLEHFPNWYRRANPNLPRK